MHIKCMYICFMYRKWKSHEPSDHGNWSPWFYSSTYSTDPPTLCLSRHLQLPPTSHWPKNKKHHVSMFLFKVLHQQPISNEAISKKVSGQPLPLRSIGWPAMPSLASPTKARWFWRLHRFRRFWKYWIYGFCNVYIYYYVYICLLYYIEHYLNWLVGFCPWTVGSSTMGENIFLMKR